MCSSTDKAVAASDIALQTSQIAANKALLSNYAISSNAQQSVLNSLKAKLNYVAANPMGYTPAQLHAATTSINENTASAAKKALGSAAAFAAAHGSADIGGGATGEIAGEIGSAAAQSKAQSLSTLSNQNEELKQKNFWTAINGLNAVGSEYGGASSTAIGGANNAADTAIGAGKGAVDASTAETAQIGGLISGIGGLVSAGTGFIGANPGGIFGA